MGHRKDKKVVGYVVQVTKPWDIYILAITTPIEHDPVS